MQNSITQRHSRVRPVAAVIAVMAVIAMTAAACGSSSDSASSEGTTLTIGVEGTLTGAAAAFGVPQENGMQLAVDQINQAGGIKIGGSAVKLKLDVQNDESSATTGVEIVNKMLQSGDHYILGTLLSNIAGAYVPIIENSSNVIDIVDGATLPGLTDHAPIYRFTVDTPSLDIPTINFAVENHWTRVAVLSDSSHAGYVADTAAFKSDLSAAGISLVSFETYQEGGNDQFGAQLTRMLSAKPDALIFRGETTDLVPAVKQARQLGWNGPIISSAGFAATDVTAGGASSQFANEFDVALAQALTVAAPSSGFPAALRQGAATFLKEYQTHFNAGGDTELAGNGYDSVYVLAAAIKKAGSTSNISAVRKALNQLQPGDVQNLIFPFPKGGLVFDTRQARFEMVVNKWNGSAWVVDKIVSSTPAW
jgi:branched-chain amino acid transport system substrate-binding protein